MFVFLIGKLFAWWPFLQNNPQWENKASIITAFLVNENNNITQTKANKRKNKKKTYLKEWNNQIFICSVILVV